MRSMYFAAALLLAALGCGSSGEPGEPAEAVIVAAASNLDRAVPKLVEDFESATGLKAVVSLGSSSNLTQQIENGAPFDVYLSADTSNVDKLIAGGFAEPASKYVYARGRLALWARTESPLQLTGPEVLLDPSVKFISIANPGFAPYGMAAEQALDRLGYSDQLQGKIVYAQSISMAQQYADFGNADIAVTALSLTTDAEGKSYELDAALYEPIEQALAVLATSLHKDAANRFAAYMKDAGAQAILKEFGYGPGD
jgi:molybdate transport system substrate-binding protein